MRNKHAMEAMALLQACISRYTVCIQSGFVLPDKYCLSK